MTYFSRLPLLLLLCLASCTTVNNVPSDDDDNVYIEDILVIKNDYFSPPSPDKVVLLVASDQLSQVPDLLHTAFKNLQKNIQPLLLLENKELQEAWLTNLAQEPSQREEDPETQIAALAKKVKTAVQESQNESVTQKLAQESLLLAQKILLKNPGASPSYPILAFWVSLAFAQSGEEAPKTPATIFAKYASLQNMNLLRNQTSPELFHKILNTGKREMQYEKKITFEMEKDCQAFANGEAMKGQKFWIPKSLPTLFTVSCPRGFYANLINPEEISFIPVRLIPIKNETAKLLLPTAEIINHGVLKKLNAKYIISLYWLESSHSVQATILNKEQLKVIKKISFFYDKQEEKSVVLDKIADFIRNTLLKFKADSIPTNAETVPTN